VKNAPPACTAALGGLIKLPTTGVDGPDRHGEKIDSANAVKWKINVKFTT